MTVEDLRVILDHAPDDAIVYRIASSGDGELIEICVKNVRIKFSADGSEILLI